MLIRVPHSISAADENGSITIEQFLLVIFILPMITLLRPRGLELEVDGEKRNGTIHKVLYVPDLNRNLLSVSNMVS
jgi:hypothetical protein